VETGAGDDPGKKALRAVFVYLSSKIDEQVAEEWGKRFFGEVLGVCRNIDVDGHFCRKYGVEKIRGKNSWERRLVGILS